MGDDEGRLWSAVAECVASIAHLEKQWDSEKLSMKLREYFKKGVKHLRFGGKSWDELINDYTDSVFDSIFMALGDRSWLPQADFLFCVDAGIKDLFPPQTMARVPQQVFEQCVLKATDRSFDEQRYWTYRWDTVQRVVQGKTTQKRVREALDVARQEAVEAESGQLQGFLAIWIAATTRILAGSTPQGDPRSCLEEEKASELFHALVQDGSLPMQLVAAEGLPPQGWPAVDATVTETYWGYATEEEHGKAQQGRRTGKGGSSYAAGTAGSYGSCGCGSGCGSKGGYKSCGKGGRWQLLQMQRQQGGHGNDCSEEKASGKGVGKGVAPWMAQTEEVCFKGSADSDEQPLAKRWKGGR